MLKFYEHPFETQEEKNQNVTTSIEKSSTGQFKHITMDEARRSKEYWSIMKHAFMDTSKRPLIIGSIKEPLDTKYLEHAKFIREGDPFKLDFNDPQFIRNIYKALRLECIDANQLGTVTLWYYALEFFKNNNGKASFNLYSFEDKGPYNPEIISYATAQSIADFQKSLINLPAHEKTYLTVDLPPEHEILYLLLMLVRTREDRNSYVEVYLSFLKKYLEKTDTSKEDSHALLSDLPNLYKKANIEAALHFLVKQFTRAYPMIEIINEDEALITYDIRLALGKAADTFKGSKLAYTLNNYALFVGNLIVGDQNPSLVLSPNYSSEESNSPLLSIVLPTLPALYALQTAVHQKDTTYPVLTVGQLSTRDLLHTLMDSTHNLRCVELVHPDVRYNEKPHGVITTPFMLTWHDYFHTWRNGANIYKDFMCYLIQSLQTYKKFDMSKVIWKLTDMDISLGRLIRIQEKRGFALDIEKIDQFSNFLEMNAGDSFFTLPEFYDDNLLIIIDMVLNREAWKKYLGEYPEDFLPKDGLEWLDRGREAGNEVTYRDYKRFQSILANMKEIVLANPQKDPYCASLFYVLSYRLKDNHSGLSMLAQLNSLGLDTFFSWDRNDGIYYKNADNNKVLIRRSTPEDLCRVMSICLTKTARSSSPSFFKDEGASQKTTPPTSIIKVSESESVLEGTRSSLSVSTRGTAAFFEENPQNGNNKHVDTSQIESYRMCNFL